mmetsp:Transcript_20821/g.34334  ORF Transcript_20821/g.34334 Transcript_20821/m.34334 type:complete len:504 (-) Transcript_20821:71-1582(-)
MTNFDVDEENLPSSSLDLEVKLPGLFRPELSVDNRQDAEKIAFSSDFSYSNKVRYVAEDDDAPTLKIRDARTHQDSPLTEDGAASLFHKKGFCLFPHQTKVKRWNEDYLKGMIFGSDISKIYALELESIIRNYLLPEYHVISVDCPPAVLRRGPSSKNEFYGTGVHQDYGLTLEDYKSTLAAYDPTGQVAKQVQKKFDTDEVYGMMVINFWRTIGGYTKANPLRSKPLAVCDPAFVNTNDTVHTALDAKVVGGIKGKQTDQMALKYSSQQHWYYYPNMTDDEVLVFKQFEVWKDDPMSKRETMPVRGVFHTAFEDPTTPEGCPPRKSTECRVQVFVGKRKDEDSSPSEEKCDLPAPLWPKSGSEWGWLACDMGSIGMIFAAAWSECPAIPEYLNFIISFAVVGMLEGLIKFQYSLRREGNDKRYPCAHSFSSILGLIQLALGIWGMALVFPNVAYLSNPSPETCETGPIIAMFIPSIIIAVVLVGLVGYGIYSFVVKKRSECE